MADIVTGTVTGLVDTSFLQSEHSDIRMEQAAQAASSAYQSATQHGGIVDAVKTAGWHNSDRTSTEADRLAAQGHAEFIATSERDYNSSMMIARDTADLRAQVIQAIDTTKLATELNALKSIIEGQKNTTYLSDKISLDGEKTRGLINDLKYHDLNRALVERNAELVEERWGRRYWRDCAGQNQYGAQFASLQNQVQAFGSQLQETRQGMVNLGTMVGVGQNSTNNNI